MTLIFLSLAYLELSIVYSWFDAIILFSFFFNVVDTCIEFPVGPPLLCLNFYPYFGVVTSEWILKSINPLGVFSFFFFTMFGVFFINFFSLMTVLGRS